jgi:SAM-dependent methyltransferase
MGRIEPPGGGEPGDVTLASYEAAAERYRERSAAPSPALRAYLDRLARLVGAGTVLELGSGLGWDAAYLESRGPRVLRTDATRAFDALRADGYEALLLDVRRDEWGGPYAAVLANAVLLHLTRGEFADVLRRARQSVVEQGILGLTLKEGDGDAWSTAKLDLPRHFTYWREPAIREALEQAGWSVLSIEQVAGRTDVWLYVLARASEQSMQSNTVS